MWFAPQETPSVICRGKPLPITLLPGPKMTVIDGACEVNGQVEVFVSNVEDASCVPQLGTVTYPADAVRLPQTDLPIVFRESQIGCNEWLNQLQRLK